MQCLKGVLMGVLMGRASPEYVRIIAQALRLYPCLYSVWPTSTSWKMSTDDPRDRYQYCWVGTRILCFHAAWNFSRLLSQLCSAKVFLFSSLGRSWTSVPSQHHNSPTHPPPQRLMEPFPTPRRRNGHLCTVFATMLPLKA